MGLPGLNQYRAADKVSCSRTQHSDSGGGESQTSNPLIPSLPTEPLCSVVNKYLRAVLSRKTMPQYNMETKFYYIPINDTSFELSVFWSSDTESRINELRFSDSVSLSFKTRLMSDTGFCSHMT